MACNDCGDKVATALDPVERQPPPNLVLVQVANHTDKYSLLFGKASGKGYAMRRNGSRFYAIKEDVDAEPDKFVVVADSDLAGNRQSYQTVDSRTRAGLPIGKAPVSPGP